MSKEGTLYKTQNGFTWESHGLFTWEMKYDIDGVYIGQIQDDMVEGGIVFLRATNIDGVPCVNGKPVPQLTPSEMKGAKSY